jgi:hypothetical protein
MVKTSLENFQTFSSFFIFKSFLRSDPALVCKTSILEDVVGDWSLRWINFPTCRQTKIWLPTPDLKKSAKLLALDLSHLGIVRKYVTGHNFLMPHKNIFMSEIFDDPV